MRDTSLDLKNALREKKKVRDELHDLVKTLYLTLKIEELSLKNTRSMLELINDRLRQPMEQNMDSQ